MTVCEISLAHNIIAWADSVGFPRLNMSISYTNMNDTSEILISEYAMYRDSSFPRFLMKMSGILLCDIQKDGDTPFTWHTPWKGNPPSPM